MTPDLKCKITGGRTIGLDKTLRLIRKVNGILAETNVENELLQKICKAIVGTKRYKIAWVSYIRKDVPDLQIVAHAGAGDEFPQSIKAIPANRLKQPFIVQDVKSDERIKPWRNDMLSRGCLSTISIPLIMQRHTIGTLNVCAGSTNFFDKNDFELLKGLALDISQGIQKIRQHTDQKNAEKALLDSERNFYNSIENSPLGIRIATATGETIYANRATLEIYGYASVNDFNTIPSIKRLTPDSYIAHKERAEKRRRGEYVPPEYETSIVRKNGEVRHLSVTRSETLWNGEKQFEVVYRDITGVKIAEEKLKQSTAAQQEAEQKINLQAQFLDAASDAIFLHDGNGNFIYVNEAACKITGYSMNELLKMRVNELDIMEHGELARKHQAEIEATGTACFESAHNCKDGSIIPVEIRSNMIEWQGQPLIFSVSRDISERKQAEQKIQASEEKFRLLAENATDIVFRYVMVPLPHFEYVSPSVTPITGYPPEEYYSDPYLFQKLIPGEDLFEMEKHIQQAEVVQRPLIFRCINKSGDIKYLEHRYRIFSDNEGRYTAIEGIIRDITERYLIEEEAAFRAQLLDAATDAIIAHDKTGKVIYANDAAARSQGYTKEEIITKNTRDLIGPGLFDHVRSTILKQLDEKGEAALESVNIRKDGSTYPVEMHSTLVNLEGRDIVIGITRDITERKKAEEELKFRAQLLDSANEYILVTGQAGKLVYCNEAACRALGYARKEMDHLNIEDIVPREDFKAPEIQFVKKLKETGKILFERHLRRKDESLISVEIQGRLIKINNNEFILFIMRDLTERKKAEQELKLQAQLLDVQMDTIFVVDLEGNLIYVNQAACLSLEYSKEELLKMNLHDLTSPKSGKLIPLRIKEVVEKGQASFEVTRVRKDRKEIPMEIHTHLTEWDGRKLILSLSRDISDRKAAEQRLQASEAKYHGIFNQAPISIFVMDKDGKITDVNPYHIQVTCKGQIPPERFLGKCIFDIQAFMQAGILEEHRRLLKGEPINLKDVHFESSDFGPQAYFNIRGMPIFENNEVNGAIQIMEDITERKRADETTRQSYEKLQQTLRGVTQAITASIEIRDPYTAGHQHRVATLARAIAIEMGLSEEHADQIYTAGLIHDIGKISIPSEILSKPGRLGEIEFSLIKMHPQAGYDILRNIDFPYPLAQWVLEHHERMNGSGYPSGLTGDKISKEARVLGVADVMEAMSSHRPYRPSLGTAPALEEITHNKNILYDGEVVDACFRLFYEKGFKLE